MNNCSRRDFLLASAGLSALFSAPSARCQTAQPLLFIHLFANGGWDSASFCDPKLNTTQKVNTWAQTLDIQQAGNIKYAPVANNADLFSKHFDKMLVINGINAQTNVHSAGRLKNLTGQSRAGYPSIATLHAATFGDLLPLPLLVGNSFETGGLIAATQINGGLMSIINSSQLSGPRSLSASQMQFIERDLKKSVNTSANQSSGHFYKTAMDRNSADFLPKVADFYSALATQDLPNHPSVTDMRFALAAFAAGASLACDYSITGFDTHGTHDKGMLAPMQSINLAALAAWAFAEQLGLSDRLVVLISSDFGRTPFYNDVAGKDHWPFHSAVIMKKNVPWGNKVIGATDDKLVGRPLNPSSLELQDDGILLSPHHIHQALRQYLTTNSSLTNKHPLDNALEHNFLQV
jgi:uncharacterized protein (DUF1501 family)